MFKHSRKPSQSIDIIDVDVTPVMNLFIILIPFLISMVVFTHFAVIRFSLPANETGGSATASQKPVLKLTIVLDNTYILLTHGETVIDSLATTALKPYDALLKDPLARCRQNPQFTDEVIIASRNLVTFESIVKVMDLCREAGFSRIGMTNATEDPDKGV